MTTLENDFALARKHACHSLKYQYSDQKELTVKYFYLNCHFVLICF